MTFENYCPAERLDVRGDPFQDSGAVSFTNLKDLQ